MTVLFIEAYLAAAAPGGRTAISWPGGTLDGQALRARVLGLAGWMAASGVAKGDRVVLCLPKGPCAVICQLAAFAAGAVAVPLDGQLPQARVRDMLADLEPALVIAGAGQAAGLCGPWPAGVLEVEPDDPGSLPCPDSPDSQGIRTVAAEDPALILMTSGSTGRPKGVVLGHGNITTFIDWAIAEFGLSASDSFLSLAPLHFDLSLLDICASQRVGASVHLLPDGKAGFAQEVMKALAEHAVTVLYTVPTQLRLLVGLRAFDRARVDTLRWLLSAGEVLQAATLRALSRSLPNCRFANLYGPTETNVVCCHVVEEIAPEWAVVPIGRPCSHAVLTIRDPMGQVLAAGQEGEICVQGPSVMLGYWRRAGLTEAARIDGDRASYRTGDFGWAGPDGGIRFLGRRDAQVKIRGFRIELGEIEAAALDTGRVRLAAALPVPGSDGTMRIALAVVGADPESLDEQALIGQLAESLPPQARPAWVVGIDEMPRTSSGKIDRQRLTGQLAERGIG